MLKNTSTDFFYSGTSGLVLPFNKMQYPADFKNKSKLHYYASLFNSLEINSTFYKLPKNVTVNNWAESVPKDFRFTLKLPKSITHSLELEYAYSDLIDFIQVVGQVGDKKGCLLAQFPPSLTVAQIEPFKEVLKIFTQEIDLSSWKIAVEFRHPSWYKPQIYQLLKSFNSSMVLHDMKNCSTPPIHPDNDFIYLRFHGPEPRYRGSYSDEFLKQLAESIVNWIGDGKTVYAYFNNTLGAAFTNLQTLNNFVKIYMQE